MHIICVQNGTHWYLDFHKVNIYILRWLSVIHSQSSTTRSVNMSNSPPSLGHHDRLLVLLKGIRTQD